MYLESEDPIIRGYNSKSNLIFIMDFVRNMYNHYKSRKSKLVWKAAYLFYNLNNKHPFTDGNKRTALITTNSFLEHNGYSIGTLPYRKSFNFIKDVAKGKKNIKDCHNFLNKELREFKIAKETHEQISKIIAEEQMGKEHNKKSIV